jgi:cytochrome b561
VTELCARCVLEQADKAIFITQSVLFVTRPRVISPPQPSASVQEPADARRPQRKETVVADLEDQKQRIWMQDLVHDESPRRPGMSPADRAEMTTGAGPAQAPDSAQRYTPVQRGLHWIVAGLVAVQLALGIYVGMMIRQPHDRSSLRSILIVHLTIGTIIFLLMCKRLAVRNQLGAPPPPKGTPLDAAALARLNHLGFYALLLAMPVFGWLAFLSPPRAAAAWGAIHGSLALVLVVAICAHLCGVVYHQFIRRDGLLSRMLG